MSVFFNFKQACIAFIWLAAAGLISPQFLTNNGFVLEGFLVSCSWDYLSYDYLTRIYMMVMIIGGFIIPFVLIIVFAILAKIAIKSREGLLKQKCSLTNNRDQSLNNQTTVVNDLGQNCELILKMDENEKHVDCEKEKNEDEDEDGESPEEFPPTEDDRSYRKKSSQKSICDTYSEKRIRNILLSYEKQVNKRIILSIFFFSLAWSPYAIITLYAQFGSNIENVVTPYTTALPAIFAKLSSVYNPIVYTLTNMECREYLKATFLKKNV